MHPLFHEHAALERLSTQAITPALDSVARLREALAESELELAASRFDYRGGRPGWSLMGTAESERVWYRDAGERSAEVWLVWDHNRHEGAWRWRVYPVGDPQITVLEGACLAPRRAMAASEPALLEVS